MCLATAHQCHPSGQMDCGNVCCSMNSGRDSDVGRTLLPSMRTFLTWDPHMMFILCMTDPCMIPCNNRHKHETQESFTSRIKTRMRSIGWRLWSFLIWLCKIWKYRWLSALWRLIWFVGIALRGCMSNVVFYFCLFLRGCRDSKPTGTYLNYLCLLWQVKMYFTIITYGNEAPVF